MLNSELEKDLSRKKNAINLKLKNFDNASKSLDKLIGSQIPDKSRKGMGFASYNAVPPPLTGLFSPLKIDLSNSNLEEFQQPEFEGYGPKPSKSVSEDTSNKVRGSLDAPLIEELMNMVPRAVLMKTHLRSLNTVRPKTVNNARPNSAVVNVVRANQVNAVKDSSCWVWRRHKSSQTNSALNYCEGHPQKENQGYVDSRCSRRMTRNMSYLSDLKEFDGGYVTFGGGAKGGKITSKGTLKTGKLDFEDVYFVKELQFNLFSVSQMCDKKNSVLFTNTGCFVLSPEFMLAVKDGFTYSPKRTICT
ncbi:hypothetical protein Tco_0857409 [Tanacetum coccineum]|uniref:Retrovirus-related Pol polyprotein from transposon TNT 1-94-like beta-barrel domain-containing protein n=1 Tax=Tanacetum coccineum TaxID=301880 RepID=A0ABQ5B8B2_9ASTR